MHIWTYPILVILFRHFGFIVPKHFQIISLSNLSILSVPDDGYFRNASVERTKFDIYVFIVNQWSADWRWSTAGHMATVTISIWAVVVSLSWFCVVIVFLHIRLIDLKIEK